MSGTVRACTAAALVCLAVGIAPIRAAHFSAPLVVTMSNDPAGNQIRVYDAASRTLVQALSTRGKGGVSGNARGLQQSGGELLAAVNNGSGTVAIFRRAGRGFRFDKLVVTSSAPVSVDFANGHMYVAGATTVDSFVMHGSAVGWLDGSASLELAGGGMPPAGSTAQVGAVDPRHLLVTLKADPDPGTVDVVALRRGAVEGGVTAVSAPAGTLTPFGFSVYPDGTALVTLAHSSHDGVFRDGAFSAIAAAGQTAPCWTTRVGKYVFTANTGSGTISRVLSTGTHVFVDAPVAATIVTGAPSDIDAAGGLLAVIDHGAGQAHLSTFTYNRFGELLPTGSPISLDAPDANGVAVVPSDPR
jgi:hypothetical protein